MYQPTGILRSEQLDCLSDCDRGDARSIREVAREDGPQARLFTGPSEVTEFSILRASAGFELLDVAERFDASFPSVARWETGLEDAPMRILDALRRASEGASPADSAKLENTLLEGNCLELMKLIPDQSVHLVLCDLPYGTTQNRWDSVIDLRQLWSEYRRILKPNGVIVLTAQGIFTAKLILSNEDWFKYKIVWEKSKPTNFLNAKKQPLRKHEDVCVFYTKPPTYNPQMRQGAAYDKGIRKNQLSGSYGDFQPAHVKSEGGRYPADIVYFKTAESEPERTVWHPTQKPVELGRYLIRTYSNAGDVVLDNAFGSGSFLVAAALEKRHFIGIERNEEVHLFKDQRIDYVAVAAERLARAGANPRILRASSIQNTASRDSAFC